MTHLFLQAAASAPTSVCLAQQGGFYVDHRAVVWGALGAFVVLGALIIALVWNLLRRRRAERALRQSEGRHRLLVETAADVIAVRDTDGKAVFVSPSCQGILGYGPEELIAQPPFALIHPEDADRCRTGLGEAFQGRDTGTVEYRFRHKDGQWIWLASRMRVLPAGPEQRGLRILVISRDVTARKQAEEDLLREKRFADALYESLPGIAFAADADRRMVRCNRNLEELVGVPREELVGGPLWKFVTERDQARSREAFETAMAQGRATVEVHVVDSHGREVPYQFSAVRMGAGDGTRVVAVGLDVSDRNRAEEALRESEVRYHALFEFAGDAIFLMEGDRFVDCNERAVEMFRCPRDQIIGARPTKFSPPRQPDGRDSSEKAAEKIGAALAGKPQFFEWKHQRGGGTLFDADVALTRVELEGKRMLLATVRDVTQRKQVEREQAMLKEELHQAQKMEAVGQLAGGAAHDFNNLLTVILGNASLARLTVPEDSSARPLLDQIAKAGEQASELTRSLLTFSRKLPATKARIDLRHCVKEAGSMLKRMLPASIELVVEGTTGGPLWIHADPTQIQQIVMNLAVNARDAMPDGGTLRIAAAPPGDGQGAAPPEQAQLVVSDTGEGMTPEVLSRVFEPFFTTKPRGQGTGLGLSTVHGIIADHDGWIDVRSTPGEGSTFTVTLRIAPEHVEGETDQPLHEAPLGQGQQLLLAEDNPLVAHAVTAMLRSLRYEVARVGDGEALLAQLADRTEEYALLIVDVDLPKRSGLDALKEIRAGGSDVPVIIVTGTTGDEVNAQLDRNTILLPKPFELRQLADAVAGLLGGHAGPDDTPPPTGPLHKEGQDG